MSTLGENCPLDELMESNYDVEVIASFVIEMYIMKKIEENLIYAYTNK